MTSVTLVGVALLVAGAMGEVPDDVPRDRVGEMIPWLIVALVLVPLVMVGFASMRRRTAAAEHPVTEDAGTRARTEREFAEAEAYEAQWREENADRHRERMP